MKYVPTALFCLSLLIWVNPVSAQNNNIERLFLPERPDEWYIFLKSSGKDSDPLKVFRFEGNTLHVSGEDFGYICTKKIYGDYHLRLEFKWGEKKYPPRENAKRDAGILYHCQTFSSDRVWPLSLEFQIQEGDCGDFWMTGGSQIWHNDTLTLPGGAHRVIKSRDAEKPTGQWNTVEVIVKDGKLIHKINGVVVNEGARPSLTRGRILLQSEGAELFYRNVELTEF